MHRIGTAGWSIPPSSDTEGSRLQRYSHMLNCSEINSTFYRPHRLATLAKWATETPNDFRFSIKAPKTITHDSKLRGANAQIKTFLDQVHALGEKVGPILFQLPPSLAFDRNTAESFLGALRELDTGEAVVEPRHESWFTLEVDLLLNRYKISRVASDPPKGAPEASEPGGSANLVYYRLHGSPRTYYSSYEGEYLSALAMRLAKRENVWVIFDNTASGSAFANALALRGMLTQIESGNSGPSTA